MTTATLTILGVSDDVTGCECCGKTGLKRTVALGDADGAVVYYGTDCAARALGVTGKQVDKDVRSAARKAADERAAAHARRINEEGAAYDSWLLATYGDTRSDLARHRRYKAEVGA